MLRKMRTLAYCLFFVFFYTVIANKAYLIVLLVGRCNVVLPMFIFIFRSNHFFVFLFVLFFSLNDLREETLLFVFFCCCC